MNITVLFAVALFLAAAFFVTYSEPNESDAAGTGTADDPWYCGPGNSGSVKATLINGVLTISGDGAMGDYSYSGSTSPWYGVRTDITSIVIESGVTYIGTDAFYRCTNLKSVTIPNSVTTIGTDAFWYCTGLRSIVIPYGVTAIGETAFKDCTDLRSVTIPDSVKNIGAAAFEGCTNLGSVTIPDSVETIGIAAFEGCTGLRSVTIPDSVAIGTDAFKDCSKLETITVTGGSEGTPTLGGVIEEYFKDGVGDDANWKLPGLSGTTPTKYLFLQDISSSEYAPDENIAGDSGRTVLYSDKAYTYSGSWEETETFSVSGTLTVTGGESGKKGVIVALVSTASITYTAKTDENGEYTAIVLKGAHLSITASITGYSLTSNPDEVYSLTESLTGQNITLTALYTVSGKLTVTGGSASAENQTVNFGTYH
ncbi:MAG: leucine-rich repeat domain-containing protein, partial [Candidatus Methanoplasma sp.]|nr:leucine-rich repeat domain-containing protein [Candidatus Methanoplasma sp.]